ncbi:MAG: hypothetical protein WA004_10205 [Saprospiraceae bacterium]
MKLPKLSTSVKRKKVAIQGFSTGNVTPSCSCTEDIDEISDSDSPDDHLLLEEIYEDTDVFDDVQEDFEQSDDSSTAEPGDYDQEY